MYIFKDAISNFKPPGSLLILTKCWKPPKTGHDSRSNISCTVELRFMWRQIETQKIILLVLRNYYRILIGHLKHLNFSKRPSFPASRSSFFCRLYFRSHISRCILYLSAFAFVRVLMYVCVWCDVNTWNFGRRHGFWIIDSPKAFKVLSLEFGRDSSRCVPCEDFLWNNKVHTLTTPQYTNNKWLLNINETILHQYTHPLPVIT